jgi:hypothetical protein
MYESHYTFGGFIACVIGTALEAFIAIMFHLDDRSIRWYEDWFCFEDAYCTIFTIGHFALLFAVWWSFPFAWYRGMLMDPIIAMVMIAVGVIFSFAGCVGHK